MRPVFGIWLALLAAADTAPDTTQVGYLGGSGTDDCDGIALDRAGDIYQRVTPTLRLPACLWTSPTQAHGTMDAIVVKVEASTGRLVWVTRTGGSDWDAAGSVEVANMMDRCTFS